MWKQQTGGKSNRSKKQRHNDNDRAQAALICSQERLLSHPHPSRHDEKLEKSINENISIPTLV